MTMTEKILARAANKSQVSPGENLWVGADVLMTHDVCGPGTIGIFKKEFGADAKVGQSFLYWSVCFTSRPNSTSRP